MRLVLLFFVVTIIGATSHYYLTNTVTDPSLEEVDEKLAVAVSDMKTDYLKWEQSVNNIQVKPILSKGGSLNETVLPSDTLLFLEHFAVQQLGRDLFYDVLKPRLLSRQRKTGENPNHHMMMFFIESKFNLTAQNWQKNKNNKGKHLVAVGLNQMTHMAIKDANMHGSLPKIKSLSHYLHMSLDKQLDYAFQHYDLFRSRYPKVTLDTPFEIYAVTFYPRAATSSNPVIAKPNSLVAKQNSGYVLKHGKMKGYITKWSIKYYILKIITKQSSEYHPDVHGQLMA